MLRVRSSGKLRCLPTNLTLKYVVKTFVNDKNPSGYFMLKSPKIYNWINCVLLEIY